MCKTDVGQDTAYFSFVSGRRIRGVEGASEWEGERLGGGGALDESRACKKRGDSGPDQLRDKMESAKSKRRGRGGEEQGNGDDESNRKTLPLQHTALPAHPTQMPAQFLFPLTPTRPANVRRGKFGAWKTGLTKRRTCRADCTNHFISLNLLNFVRGMASFFDLERFPLCLRRAYVPNGRLTGMLKQ